MSVQVDDQVEEEMRKPKGQNERQLRPLRPTQKKKDRQVNNEKGEIVEDGCRAM